MVYTIQLIPAARQDIAHLLDYLVPKAGEAVARAAPADQSSLRNFALVTSCTLQLISKTIASSRDSEAKMSKEIIDEVRHVPHPGGLIRGQIVNQFGLSVTEAAEALGISRNALSAVLNGRAALSPDMALRLEKVFDLDMKHLMRMQNDFDIEHARKKAAEINVARYVRPTPVISQN